jgi:hypothetical protein
MKKLLHQPPNESSGRGRKDLEHFRAANRASAFHGRTSIFHGDFFRVLHVSFGLAFHTVACLGHGNLHVKDIRIFRV